MDTELAVLVREILSDSYVAMLGTVDDVGPWIAPVIFVFDENNAVYWMSEHATRHSRAVERDARAAVTIAASVESTKERALQMEGRVEKVTGHMREQEKRLYSKIGKPVPPKLDEKFENGYSWYKFTPEHIELIHNEQFGWERKKFV